ncbi:MAG TPA: hypothetical protein VLA13_05110 [Massilibacterium sp.]|nr:hypothetical protein [Massilibacterium sp.]
MNVSFVGRLIEVPEYKTIGKNNTSLATLKVSEDVKTKNRETGKWEVSGKNHYEVKIFGDKALEAQFLEVGALLDFRHYQNEGEDFIRWRARINEETWTWKNKEYSKLAITAKDYELIEKED